MLDANYVAWGVVAALALTLAWLVRRGSKRVAVQIVGVGLTCVAVAVLLGVLAGMRGPELAQLFTIRSTGPGIAGYAATKLIVLGYAIVGAAAIHLVRKAGRGAR
jgi:hypothetical protein